MRFMLTITITLLGCDLQRQNPFYWDGGDSGDSGGGDGGDGVAPDATLDASGCSEDAPECIPQEYRHAENVWPPGHAMGPATGAMAWVEHGCSACHGIVAQGGESAPPLAGTALSDAYLAWTIREGRGDMPAYPEGTVNQAELWGIVTWLRLIPAPQTGQTPEQ